MKNKEWRIQGKKVDFFSLSKELGVSPMTVRLMCNRGLREAGEMRRFLSPDRSQLYDPFLMKDMDLASELIIKKINEKKHIRIVGDYDIDGVTSVAILYKGLKKAGAGVDWYIPHRVHDGYGLNMRIIDTAIEDKVDTILTCDNGISAREEVRHAKENGLTVIVTDHHDIPAVGIPKADAVVDPKQEECNYPFKEICGAVVALKFIMAVYKKLSLPEELYEDFFELAAIATVGDVVELMDENRLIVSLGLQRLPSTKLPGLKALISECGLTDKKISSYTIGFVLGPCINAAGRLESAAIAEELMISEEYDEKTSKLASRLKELNDSRKEMTEKAVAVAVNTVEEKYMDDRVLVVYIPECGESIAGIVAGRIRERYYKPSIILTDSADAQVVKGSGRSIGEYSMFKELEKVGDLLLKFGGHPLAAGMSMEKDNIDSFRKELNDKCTLTQKDLTEKIWIDLPLPISQLSNELVEELERLEPFGKGNEKPVFAEKDLRIISGRRLGSEGQYLKLLLIDNYGNRIEGMLFRDADEFIDELERAYGEGTKLELYKGFEAEYNPTRLSVIYYPSINEFRNIKTVQIVITDYHFH